MKVKTNLKAGAKGLPADPGPLNHNETLVRDLPKARGLKVKTHLKAGGVAINHNETLVRDLPKARGLKVKTHLKAGGVNVNHNETLVRDRVK
jgi:hypothetical protein